MHEIHSALRTSTSRFGLWLLLGAISAACSSEASKHSDPSAAGSGGAGGGGHKPHGSGGEPAGGEPGGDGGTRNDPGDDGGTGGKRPPEPDDDAGGEGGAAGSPSVFGMAPPLRHSLDLEDLELGKKALKLMGSASAGGEGSCRNCHSLGRSKLSSWLQMTRLPADTCLTDASLDDQEKTDAMYSCLFAAAKPKKTGYWPEQHGIFAAAAHLPWFTFLFDHASAHPDQEVFVRHAGMPRQGTKLTQGEFDVIAEWFMRGLPKLEELVPADPGMPCKPSISASLKAHVEEHIKSGWRAKNAQSSLLMYGCERGAGADCLSEAKDSASLPQGKDWNVIPGGHLRVLFDNSGYLTQFWTRASADGRYLASGSTTAAKTEAGDGAQIIDLKRGARIGVNASYDPGFFPDNSGFVFMGAVTDEVAKDGSSILMCSQSLLPKAPLRVSGSEPECRISTSQSIGLYEGVGKSLAGSDYFAASGSFESDDPPLSPLEGFYAPPGNPLAPFESDSTVTVTPLINDGRSFVEGTATTISVPLQGDPMLSPSAGLLVMRTKGVETKVVFDPTDPNSPVEYVAQQAGYALHLVKGKKVSGKLQTSLEPAGSICTHGGKATISYDERWMVFHQYITDESAIDLGFSGPDDPKFLTFKERGGSNLVLVDLLSGSARRITNVSPGQFALFPNFRSDGWIYFVLRSQSDEKEYFMASDAALILEQ